VLLLTLSSGHKLGLGLSVLVFIGFSLFVSMGVPRWRPQFPGRALPVFLAVAVLLFVGMVAAVLVFGKEKSEAAAAGTHVKVTEVEYKIQLTKTTFSPGTYTFDIDNAGKVVHNLNVQGGGATEATQDINPGKTAALTVELKRGSYDLFCSIPGHRQLGMNLKITVS
jgi:uncharacterized cupredoxin-like copper-binding protein